MGGKVRVHSRSSLTKGQSIHSRKGNRHKEKKKEEGRRRERKGNKVKRKDRGFGGSFIF